MKKILLMILGVLLFSCAAMALTEEDLERATMEVDRNFGEEAAERMRSGPRKPVIEIEGEDGELEDLPGTEGEKRIVPEGSPGSDNAEIR